MLAGHIWQDKNVRNISYHLRYVIFLRDILAGLTWLWYWSFLVFFSFLFLMRHLSKCFVKKTCFWTWKCSLKVHELLVSAVVHKTEWILLENDSWLHLGAYKPRQPVKLNRLYSLPSWWTEADFLCMCVLWWSFYQALCTQHQEYFRLSYWAHEKISHSSVSVNANLTYSPIVHSYGFTTNIY